MEDKELINKEYPGDVVENVRIETGVSQKSGKSYHMLAVRFINGYTSRSFLNDETLFCVKDALRRYEQGE